MATSMTVRRALVYGYIRKIFKKLEIPLDIKRIIEEFYPMFLDFTGSKMDLTIEEKMHLTEYLVKVLCSESNLQLYSKLLYDGSRDGLGAKQWHSKVDKHNNTLSIARTVHNHIFACFASQPFGGPKTGHFPDTKSFLCLIRTQFEDAECPKFALFDPRKDEGSANNKDGLYYGPLSHPNCGPTFGWSDVCLFRHDTRECFVRHNNHSRYQAFFGNELCGGEYFDTRERDLPLKERDISSNKHHFITSALETFEIILQ